MINLLRKIWVALKSPFAYAGLALGALAMVLLDVWRAGKRDAQREQAAREARRDKDNVDDAVGRSDSEWLKRDILRRAGKKD